MEKVKVLTIVGARPQFIKAAVVSRMIRKEFKEIILHTGQHYDVEMSDSFFKELKIPKPDYNLGIGSASQTKQVALMLLKIEPVLLREKPSMVLVYGDTNSTLAGTLAAAKLNIPVAHIEAGLRSFRRDMPEEINRVLTDHLSSLLFCPTKNAVDNLRKEGIFKGVYNVGDVMYDALLFYFREAKKKSKILSKLNLDGKCYFLATIHRAENTDSEERLKKIIDILSGLNNLVIFPIHPRTQKALTKLKLHIDSHKIRLIKPVSYFDMLMLEANAKAILTDSGGVQKEAFFLNVPCLTLRSETEWPETIKAGANKLVGIDKTKIIEAINKFNYTRLKNNVKPFGNGMACEQILEILKNKGG